MEPDTVRIVVESPPAIKERIEAYLKRADRQYQTTTQFVLAAIIHELEKMGA